MANFGKLTQGVTFIAGQDLYKGALCVLIDTSVMYLAQAGDENSVIYTALEDIKFEDKVEYIVGYVSNSTSRMRFVRRVR